MLKKKNIIASLVVAILALIQLGLLTKFIYTYENLAKNGTVYKFALMPVDPYDAFRGRYLSLRFKDIAKPNESQTSYNETIYVELTADENGFAKIISVGKAPDAMKSQNYVRATDRYSSVVWPFTRFYLQDEYARLTDQYLNEIINSHQVYATIAVKNGAGRILDIYVDDIPIIEFLKTNYQ
ncbi:MAG: GDYXXLXY domain-containing protein [Alphaproteobacteria bacterium]